MRQTDVPYRWVLIDIGCGAGGTTIEVAALVGPMGCALGVDLDSEAIETARRRALGLPQVRFLVGDAAEHAFEGAGADAVVSRFGTLHFREPRAAFRNIRLGLRFDGRLAFVCARSPEQNLWATLPIEAAERVLGPLSGPRAGQGPFAMADAASVESILADAGFHDIDFEPIDEPMWVGAHVQAAIETFSRTDGRALLHRLDPATRARVLASLADALAPHESGQGVLLPAACWSVSARA